MTEADELLRLVRVAAAAADDKKAQETLIIDVGDVFAVSDYFVITSGSNPRQVHARSPSASGLSPVTRCSSAPMVVRRVSRRWVSCV